MGAIFANLRFEGNFPVLKKLLASNFKISVEHSDELFRLLVALCSK